MEIHYQTPPPGPPIKLPPGRIPFICICSFYTALFYGVLHYCLIPWLSAPYSQLWIFWISLHIICFTIAYLLTLWCYWLTWKTQPSVVPDNWTPDTNSFDPLSNDGKIRYCEKCELWQPPRSYHCKYCKRCILMRDQHCPWMNGCIGFGNTKSYFLFLFNSLNFITMAIYITTSWLFLDLAGYEFEACNWNESFNCLVIIIITVIPGIVLCFIIFFFFWQAQLLTVNVTNQEYLQFHEMRLRNREKLRNNRATETLEKWPYDYDDIFANLKQILGPSQWLYPSFNESLHDGTRFTINPDWIARNESSIFKEPADLI